MHWSPLLPTFTRCSAPHWLSKTTGGSFKGKTVCSLAKLCKGQSAVVPPGVSLGSSPWVSTEKPQFANRGWARNSWAMKPFPLSPFALSAVITAHVTEFFERPREKRQDSRKKCNKYVLLLSIMNPRFSIIEVHRKECLGLYKKDYVWELNIGTGSLYLFLIFFLNKLSHSKQTAR